MSYLHIERAAEKSTVLFLCPFSVKSTEGLADRLISTQRVKGTHRKKKIAFHSHLVPVIIRSPILFPCNGNTAVIWDGKILSRMDLILRNLIDRADFVNIGIHITVFLCNMIGCNRPQSITALYFNTCLIFAGNLRWCCLSTDRTG